MSIFRSATWIGIYPESDCHGPTGSNVPFGYESNDANTTFERGTLFVRVDKISPPLASQGEDTIFLSPHGEVFVSCSSMFEELIGR